MKIIKKLLIFIMVTLATMHIIININSNTISASPEGVAKISPTKVGVFLYDANDQYISLVKQNLEDIQKENEYKVSFTFFDAQRNQLTQNESIEKALNQKFNLLIINLVDKNVDVIRDAVNKIINKKTPFILYSDPDEDLIKFIKSLNQGIIISTASNESGVLQGQILIDEWNKNREAIDRNGDNIMQYVMLRGKSDSPAAAARTKYSVSTINSAGIKTQEIASVPCEWNQDLARTTMESLFSTYGNKIEVVIANNDAMAIGAIEALQKFGYNTGDKSMTIPVVGIDALPAAKNLIQKGFMTGTVVQNPSATAEALYSVGMNLVSGKSPIENTNYKLDDTGIVIHLPYYEYKAQSKK